jgi:hypothetical protein
MAFLLNFCKKVIFRIKKTRCALGVNFIYNGEGHGKIVVKKVLRTVFDRAARKDSATAGYIGRTSAQASGATDTA